MAVCSLCQRLADNVRFSLLIDVKDTDVAQWTFNIISVRRLRRLCTKCCQHICLVGDLLFKWKDLVDISMDAASAASGCEKGKPKRKSSQPPESEFNEAEPAPTVDGEIDNDDAPASQQDLDQKSQQHQCYLAFLLLIGYFSLIGELSLVQAKYTTDCSTVQVTA